MHTVLHAPLARRLSVLFDEENASRQADWRCYAGDSLEATAALLVRMKQGHKPYALLSSPC